MFLVIRQNTGKRIGTQRACKDEELGNTVIVKNLTTHCTTEKTDSYH